MAIKNTWLSFLTYIFIPSTQEAAANKSLWIPGQPGLHSEFQSSKWDTLLKQQQTHVNILVLVLDVLQASCEVFIPFTFFSCKFSLPLYYIHPQFFFFILKHALSKLSKLSGRQTLPLPSFCLVSWVGGILGLNQLRGLLWFWTHRNSLVSAFWIY